LCAQPAQPLRRDAIAPTRFFSANAAQAPTMSAVAIN
jgi:hypothetical protein